MGNAKFENLVGAVLSRVVVSDGKDTITFHTTDGRKYRMYHEQDCCECVFIEDICGDLDDLIGSPILKAEETSHEGGPSDGCDYSSTWTFYNLATLKGHVTLRWLGSSNGYYSESVDFALVSGDDK